MCERKAWTKEEDQLLVRIMNENTAADSAKKMKWNQIATKISELAFNKNRKGKQCRQRWFNQLHPNINRQVEWSRQEEALLFKLQTEHGNRWAKIAKHIPGRSDNNIKNYFYSTLRKAIRKVNNYVTYHKQEAIYKNIKAFQSNTLNKILTVAENKADKKIIVGKQSADLLAKDIRDSLIQIQMNHTENQIFELKDYMNGLIRKIQDFNRICKRRKTKRKDFSTYEIQSGEDSHHSILLSNNSLSPAEEEKQLLTIKSFTSLSGNSASKKIKGKKSLDYGQQDIKEEIEESIKQVESQLLNDSVKIRQPIIPALQSSNCLEASQPNYNQSFEKTKENQSIQSHSMQFESTLNQHASNLSFIPFIPHNYFTGSGFIPTSFYPRAFLSYPQPVNTPSNYQGFQMSWRQEYAYNENKQLNSFEKESLKLLQSKSQLSKEKAQE